MHGRLCNINESGWSFRGCVSTTALASLSFKAIGLRFSFLAKQGLVLRIGTPPSRVVRSLSPENLFSALCHLGS